MKKLITATVAAAALTATVPALAQSYLDDRASALDQRIDSGFSDGSLTYGEASTLRARLRDAELMQNRYEAEGMSGWQQRAVERRYDAISSELYSMRHNTEYRYTRRWTEIW
jgi:hypothetical protein